MPDIRERLVKILAVELAGEEEFETFGDGDYSYEGVVPVGELADALVEKLGITRILFDDEHYWAIKMHAPTDRIELYEKPSWTGGMRHRCIVHHEDGSTSYPDGVPLANDYPEAMTPEYARRAFEAYGYGQVDD